MRPTSNKRDWLAMPQTSQAWTTFMMIKKLITMALVDHWKTRTRSFPPIIRHRLRSMTIGPERKENLKSAARTDKGLHEDRTSYNKTHNMELSVMTEHKKKTTTNHISNPINSQM